MTALATPVAFSVDPSTWLVIGVMLVALVAFAYSTFNKGGSDIGEHPSDGRNGTPGSSDPSEESGLGRVAEDTDGERVGTNAFSSRGTG